MNDAILQHNSDDDPLKPFYGIVDRCLRNTPLIILGSGASIDYGFPSMKQLGDEIKKRISAMAIPSNEKTAWDVFVKNFDECGDFEKSLDQLEKLDCNFLRSQVIQKTFAAMEGTRNKRWGRTRRND